MPNKNSARGILEAYYIDKTFEDNKDIESLYLTALHTLIVGEIKEKYPIQENCNCAYCVVASGCLKAVDRVLKGHV